MLEDGRQHEIGCVCCAPVHKTTSRKKRENEAESAGQGRDAHNSQDMADLKRRSAIAAAWS